MLPACLPAGLQPATDPDTLDEKLSRCKEGMACFLPSSPVEALALSVLAVSDIFICQVIGKSFYWQVLSQGETGCKAHLQLLGCQLIY